MPPRRTVLWLLLAIVCAFLILPLNRSLIFDSFRTLQPSLSWTHNPHQKYDNCANITVPAALSPQGPVKDIWKHLHHAFETHAPFAASDGDWTGPPIPTSATQATHLRAIHAHLIPLLPAFPQSLYNGRGIVVLAGGSRSEFAATSLGMLRLLGNQLPVELWFLSPRDGSAEWCRELRTQAIACRYFADYMGPLAIPAVGVWEDRYKVAAIVLSAFAEVLYLDANSIPAAKPDGLFDSQAYDASGAVLWPDGGRTTEASWAAYGIGLSAEPIEKALNHPMFDAAQVLWDKEMHWQVDRPLLPSRRDHFKIS